MPNLLHKIENIIDDAALMRRSANYFEDGVSSRETTFLVNASFDKTTIDLYMLSSLIEHMILCDIHSRLAIRNIDIGPDCLNPSSKNKFFNHIILQVVCAMPLYSTYALDLETSYFLLRVTRVSRFLYIKPFPVQLLT